MEIDNYIEKSRLLFGLAMLLQSCENEDDIFEVAYWYFPRIFPLFQGAIYLLNSSGDKVSTQYGWPEQKDASRGIPNLKTCHAFSSGSVIDSFLTSDTKCKKCQCGQFCLPLRDGKKSFGLFCFDYPENVELSSHEKGLIFITAEHLALSIANIRLKKHLLDLTTRDPLTQLFNRRYLDRAASQEVSRATRSGLPLGVILIDLDYFKKINDTLGHTIGDTVLQRVGETLKTNIRNEDIVCRYGGEEFIVLLIASNFADSLKRADTLRRAIKNMSIELDGKTVKPVTASLGVATFPLHGTTFTEVSKLADDALYMAKSDGRDRVKGAEPYVL